MTNIDELLAPYRGFRPPVAETAPEQSELLAVATPRNTVLRATRIDRGPELTSPEAWAMYDFVEALTA